MDIKGTSLETKEKEQDLKDNEFHAHLVRESKKVKRRDFGSSGSFAAKDLQKRSESRPSISSPAAEKNDMKKEDPVMNTTRKDLDGNTASKMNNHQEIFNEQENYLQSLNPYITDIKNIGDTLLTNLTMNNQRLDNLLEKEDVLQEKTERVSRKAGRITNASSWSKPKPAGDFVLEVMDGLGIDIDVYFEHLYNVDEESDEGDETTEEERREKEERKETRKREDSIFPEHAFYLAAVGDEIYLTMGPPLTIHKWSLYKAQQSLTGLQSCLNKRYLGLTTFGAMKVRGRRMGSYEEWDIDWNRAIHLRNELNNDSYKIRNIKHKIKDPEEQKRAIEKERKRHEKGSGAPLVNGAAYWGSGGYLCVDQPEVMKQLTKYFKDMQKRLRKNKKIYDLDQNCIEQTTEKELDEDTSLKPLMIPLTLRPCTVEDRKKALFFHLVNVDNMGADRITDPLRYIENPKCSSPSTSPNKRTSTERPEKDTNNLDLDIFSKETTEKVIQTTNAASKAVSDTAKSVYTQSRNSIITSSIK